MSKLSDRCEERKTEAQALADKFNAEKAEIDKLKMTYSAQSDGINNKVQDLQQKLKSAQSKLIVKD